MSAGIVCILVNDGSVVGNHRRVSDQGCVLYVTVALVQHDVLGGDSAVTVAVAVVLRCGDSKGSDSEDNL